MSKVRATRTPEIVDSPPISGGGIWRLPSVSVRRLRSVALAFALGVFLFPGLCSNARAQKQEQDRPVPLDPIQGEREARKLLQEILQQTPDAAPTNGTLRIWDADRNERSIAVHMEIAATATNWTHVYQSSPGQTNTGDKLLIVHTFGQASRYWLSQPGKTQTRELIGNQTMIPFAGSDFWVADLGLEFLHWPKQRVVKKEMRYHKSCVMLQSINPNPDPDAYARVDSWLTIESPHSPVLAQAYDSSGKLIKVFTPEEVERVAGRYQLRSIEMRNLKTKTHSIIEFDLPAN